MRIGSVVELSWRKVERVKADTQQSDKELCPVCLNELTSQPDFCPHCGTDLTTLTKHLNPKNAASHLVEFSPGNKVLGRYDIIDVLGKGGMGVIFRAFDLKQRKEVAIKTISLEIAGYEEDDIEELRKRFNRESYASSRLDHPNIVEVYDVGSVDGEGYICMEYIKGIDLDDHVVRNGKMGWQQVVDIGRQLASALQHIHERKVIHRDVKPSNFILQDDGSIKMLDFGLAKVQQVGMSAFTQEGQIMGTAQYVSPEIIQGEPVDYRSDLFSAGTVLYELVTGMNPFKGESISEVLESVVNFMPCPPSFAVPDIPAWLDRVIMACLKKKPSERFRAASELLEALGSAGLTLTPGQKALLKPGDCTFITFGRKDSDVLDTLDDSEILQATKLEQPPPPTHKKTTNVSLERDILEFYRLARKAMENEKYTKALLLYNQIIRLRFNSRRAWKGKCIALLEMGNTDEFLDSISSALSIFKDDAEMLVLKGLYLLRYSERERLANHLKRVKVKPPETTFYWLAKAELVSGSQEKAQRCIERALTVRRDWHTYYRAGRLALKCGWTEIARKYLAQAWGLNRESHLVAYGMGLVAEAMGSYKEAETLFRRSLELEPTSKPAAAAIKQLEETPLTDKVLNRAKYILTKPIF